MRMAELQKILHNNGSFKEELMQAFLTAAKASFQEHSKTSSGGGSGEGQSKTETTQQQLLNLPGLSGLNPNMVSGAGLMPSATSPMPSTSSAPETVTASSVDNVGLGGKMGVDSPSNLHSPGGSMLDISNFAALDSFLFEQGIPSTPGGSQQGGLEMLTELQSVNSPFNLSNVSLDPVSDATSPFSDLGVASPLTVNSSMVGGMSGNETLSAAGVSDLLNQNTPVTSSVPMQSLMPMQQFQQFQQQQVTTPPFSPNGAEVKTEAVTSPGSFPSSLYIKTEPLSPYPTTPQSGACSMVSPAPSRLSACTTMDINVAAIMEEVRQRPSETRRLLIEQVTDAVVDAHMTTTKNTYKDIAEADRKIALSCGAENMPDMSKLTLDVNNIWQLFMSAMVPEITKVVKFCKKLPGFVEVDMDDQIRLIKQGAFEVMMTRFSLLVDHEKQTMMDPTLSVRSPRQVIREMPMGEFLDEFFFVASQFNPLKLTDGEVGLFTSVLIICPSRKSLKNARAIAKIQALFQQALYFLMKHNHADPDMKFSQLMGLISTFRRINEEHFKALSNIRVNAKEEFNNQFPELHREIFDDSTLDGD